MTKLQKIMTRAWEIAKISANYFGGKAKQYISEALRLAWAEAKQIVSTDALKSLMAMGAKRWTKGGYDRLYLNRSAKSLADITITYHKTGSMDMAMLNGEIISNRGCGRVLADLEQSYIDLKTGVLHIAKYYDRDETELAELNILTNLAKMM